MWYMYNMWCTAWKYEMTSHIKLWRRNYLSMLYICMTWIYNYMPPDTSNDGLFIFKWFPGHTSCNGGVPCFWSSETYMTHIVCPLFSAKPLPEPVIDYYEFNCQKNNHWNLISSTNILIQDSAFQMICSKCQQLPFSHIEFKGRRSKNISNISCYFQYGIALHWQMTLTIEHIIHIDGRNVWWVNESIRPLKI